MDEQTKLIILSVVGGMIVTGVIVFLWSSIRAVKSASRRRFASRRDDPGGYVTCPPSATGHCVPARVHVPDNSPVAIYGVRAGDGCGCDGDPRLTAGQVQQIVDRANRLRAIRQDEQLDQLLQNLQAGGGRQE